MTCVDEKVLNAPYTCKNCSSISANVMDILGNVKDMVTKVDTLSRDISDLKSTQNKLINDFGSKVDTLSLDISNIKTAQNKLMITNTFVKGGNTMN